VDCYGSYVRFAREILEVIYVVLDCVILLLLIKLAIVDRVFYFDNYNFECKKNIITMTTHPVQQRFDTTPNSI